METRILGRAGMAVPVIGMGTWRTFDVHTPDDTDARLEVVRTAFDHHATFFDSSPMYGAAERVLGRAISNLGIRKEVMVATKVWTDSDQTSTQQFADAFRFFGDYVDLYQIHNLVAWQRRLAQLEAFTSAGKVRAIGITHYAPSAFPEMLRIMQTGRVDVIQIPYNARDRESEHEILPAAAALNIGVVVMRPFAEGSLVQPRHTPPASELARFAEFGVRTWPQILLKWIASDPRVSVIIPATSRAERMVENIAAGSPPWFDPDSREAVSRLLQTYS